jgi:hypothetical protein
MSEKLREYVAIVWKKDSDEPGIHEHFFAKNREEARAHLEEKFGKNIQVSLKDVEAAERPR